MTLTSLATILAVIALVCAVIAAFYYRWTMKRLAEKYRKAFEPLPQTPRQADLAYWQQKLNDQEILTHTRAAARQNDELRMDGREISCFLRRQAD